MISRLSVLFRFLFPHPDLRVLDQITKINLHRLFLSCVLLAPVNAAHILLFVFKPHPENLLWRDGIVAGHASMMVGTVLLGLPAFLLGRAKNRHGTLSSILILTACFVFLLFGASLCVIDQLVTPAAVAFFAACTGVAAIFLITPGRSMVLFASIFVYIYFGLSLTQKDPDLLLSIRVNCLTAAAMGLTISIIFWRFNLNNILQTTKIEEQKKELEYLAVKDPLTNIYNRRKFLELMDKEITRSKRTKRDLSILMIDVDHFKTVNDTYGHAAGDVVLKIIADRLNGTIRSMDTLSRFGGEEFAVLLPETNRESAVIAAERLRQSIEREDIFYENQKIKTTISCGAAALVIESHDPAGDALKKADAALYVAKRDGRNRVESSV